MFDQISDLISQLSHIHLNILILLGLALFGGTIGGRLFQKLKTPQVVGYITVGILIGQTGIGIVGEQTIEMFQPFNYFALGLIGFMIGGELKKETFRKYGRQIITVLLCEGISAFVLVFVLVGIVGSFFMEANIALALGLLLGAIASATAPAATTSVLWEYRSKGPLTTTVLGIVAMDDGLALLLFAIASGIAGAMVGNVSNGLIYSIFFPVYEILGSIMIGVISGLILSKLLRKYSEEDRILAFSIGTVMLVLGVSLLINVDILLAAMALGVTVVNSCPRKSKDMFKLIGGFTPPIYVLFFVLVGAKLNLSYMSLSMILLGTAYLIGRTAGKISGANFGARLSNASKTVQKYLPLCLFSQAGVAIGLSILVSHNFQGMISNAVVIIIVSTVFILEMAGPYFVKMAVTKAGEAGLNITEEDLIRRSKAEDIMEKNPPLVYQHMSLSKILEMFCNNPNLSFPVVNEEKQIKGIISVDNIKNTFMLTGLNEFLLAYDLMDPVIEVAKPNSPMTEVKDSLEKNRLECMPVVSDDDRVIGFIEAKEIKRLISRKIAELKEKACVR